MMIHHRGNVHLTVPNWGCSQSWQTSGGQRVITGRRANLIRNLAPGAYEPYNHRPPLAKPTTGKPIS
ncbi:hypothetical protein GmHk_U060260 [Glycine max]|nr:hypothetical protein GmHk_U060260 [Glycine max]